MPGQQFTCLITGANRGIGRALVTQYLLRPNTTVVAAVRDPKSPTALSISQLPTAEDSEVITITAENGSEEITGIGIGTLAGRGVIHLDLVIANAGIMQESYKKMIEATSAEVCNLFQVNTLGVLFLFRQTLGLMRKAREPKFVYVGSLMGSIGMLEEFKDAPLGPYGVSKAAGHFIVRRLAFEVPEVLSLVSDPGSVASEGYQAFMGTKDGGSEPDECATKMIRVIDGVSKDKHQGAYLDLEGEHLTF